MLRGAWLRLRPSRMSWRQVNTCTCGNCAAFPTHGAWLRDKGFQLMSCAPTSTGYDRMENKRWDARLDDYKAERKAGNRPAQTTTRAINQAKAISDKYGKPFIAAGAPIPGQG